MFDYSRTKYIKPNTRTTNHMPAYSTTNSALLDLFFEIGNAREVTEDMLDKCAKAYDESPQGLMAILLWARDCREGAGRRNVPRILLRKWFEADVLEPHTAYEILWRFVEVGRWDDVWKVALDTPYKGVVADLVKKALYKGDRLCAKWLPRKGPEAAKIRNLLGMSPKQYRKTIVGLTDVVETPICECNFHTIDYNKVPANAMSRYARLFNEKDAWRFTEWKEGLAKGQGKVQTKVLYPYEIIRNLWNDEAVAEAQWHTKKKELETQNTSFLPVIDVSGSMTAQSGAGVPCMDIAVSLGLMLAECGNNDFRNKFITFSERPQMHDTSKYATLRRKVSYIKGADWGYNTNLEAVFNLLLEKATFFQVPDYRMPKYILIISDMQFDQACRNGDTAMGMISRRYREAGYKLPTVVFWNVASGYKNFPTIEHKKGVIAISGFNTNLLDAIIKSPESVTPKMFLDEVIKNPRYLINSIPA